MEATTSHDGRRFLDRSKPRIPKHSLSLACGHITVQCPHKQRRRLVFETTRAGGGRHSVRRCTRGFRGAALVSRRSRSPRTWARSADVARGIGGSDVLAVDADLAEALEVRELAAHLVEAGGFDLDRAVRGPEDHLLDA